jgi:ribosomal protein S18 acetylase RimI-like enzyme
LNIHRLTPTDFKLYSAIPSKFLVEAVYRVVLPSNNNSILQLVEEKVEQPFTRDYNQTGDDNPTAWAERYDLSRWGIFAAFESDYPIGGATIALDGPIFPARSLQREDLAVLWDIRVHPEHKRRGVGSILFKHAVDWVKSHGCGQLGLETDGTNIPACKFYEKMGCRLGGILKYGYSGNPIIAEYPMLLWYLDF